jgi:hypothetical protein
VGESSDLSADSGGGTLPFVDIAAVERELCRIPEVRAARIVADDTGHLVEVHILATTGKAAKQVVRDVQSVAITSSGVDIDHRIVSVVQLEDEGTPVVSTPAPAAPAAAAPEAIDVDAPAVTSATEPAPVAVATETHVSTNGNGHKSSPMNRVVVDSVLVAKHELRAKATVTLRRGDEQAVGVSEGTVASSARWRIVAEAALNALRTLEPGATTVSVEMAGVQRIGDRALGIVTMIMVIPPHEELLAGVAPVRGGAEEDAVARAVLDATNRRLARIR